MRNELQFFNHVVLFIQITYILNHSYYESYSSFLWKDDNHNVNDEKENCTSTCELIT